MLPVPPERLDRLRPLFAGFPGLHGALEAAFEGTNGDVLVDNADDPRVARIVIGDFHCVAGDPDAPLAADALRAVPDREFLAVPESWHTFVTTTLPNAFPNNRFAFSAPDEWDRAHLTALVAVLPDDYTLERITAESVQEFKDLNETFVANFKSHADYLARGAGFGIRHNGRPGFVAGCSSYTISSSCLEFEIETHREYQRRGLALVAGARMVQHCLDNGLTPDWDAAWDGSADLADRLGFVGRRRYTAYRIGIPSGPPEVDG